jgi:hypothetical protein
MAGKVFTGVAGNVLVVEDNARLFYDLLFTASAQTLLKVARDPKHLGAEIGVISILHTWGQNLLLHPHIHCAIPAGGLSPDQRQHIEFVWHGEHDMEVAGGEKLALAKWAHECVGVRQARRWSANERSLMKSRSRSIARAPQQ